MSFNLLGALIYLRIANTLLHGAITHNTIFAALIKNHNL